MVAPLALLFFSFSTVLLLGIFVLAKAPGRAANRLFFLLCVSLSLWVLSNILVHSLSALRLIELAGRFAFMMGIWPFPLVLVFFLSFPVKHPLLSQKPLWFLIFTPACLLAILSLTDLVQRGVDLSLGRATPIYGPAHPIYAVTLTSYTVACLALPVLRLRTATDPLQRAQLRLLLAGLGTLGIGAALLQLVFPAIAGTRPLPGVAPSLATVFVGFVAYAIVKYRFLDIVVVIRRIIVAACTFLGIWAFLFVSFAVLSAFPNAFDRSDAMGWSIVAAIIGALLLPTLDSVFRRTVDHLLFYGYYAHQLRLRNLAKSTLTIYELNTLQKLLSTELPRIMDVSGCALFILADRRAAESLTSGELSACNFFASIASRDTDAKIDYELKAQLSPEEYEPFGRSFQALRATVVLPLKDKSGLVGLLALGQKRDNEVFSANEIEFLKGLAGQLAVVIRNSLLYQELAAMKEYVETTIEQMTCGVLTVDSALTVVTINPTAKRLLAIDEDSHGGVFESLPLELKTMLRRSLDSGERICGVEIASVGPNEARTTFSAATTPLLAPDGQTMGVLAVLTDLTEIKKLEAEVRRVERLATVGTLAAGVAHEIKNPLVSLKTFAQLLPQKYDDPEFRTSFSQIASAEIERINSLVEQLLRFARPPKPIAVPIDVHEPLEGTLSLLATELTKKNISVKTHYHEGPLIVHGDSEQLRQVFMNVLLNAVEALSPKGGGEIEITTGKRRRWSWIAPPSNSPLPQGYSWSDEEATIRIEDNGPGIKEAHLKYVFDPFFTTKDTGHGLGLSIAHNIVREHHGSINADNRPGGGAAFTVTLPLLETQEEKQRGETHELRAGSVP